MKKTKNLIPYMLVFALALAGSGCGSSGDSGSVHTAEAETSGKVSDKSSDSSDKKSSDKKSSDKKSSDKKSDDKSSEDKKITDTSYQSKIFDSSYVHEINVEISDEDWEDLKQNPTEKTKYKTTVTIDGETLQDVSFATKGNTSLSSVADMEDTDRYSFKLNFGKYVDDQTYHGLDKLNLNNIYADATYMKDYLAYEIFRAAGVDAPLTSYVQLSINGEVFGLYLAIEEVGDSLLARTENDGELYKPESEQLDNMGQGGGNMPQMPNGGQFPTDGNMPQKPDGESSGDNSERKKRPDGDSSDNNGTRRERPDGNEFPGNGNMPQMPDGSSFSFDGNMPQMPDGMTPPDGMEFPQSGQSGDQDSSDSTDKRDKMKDGFGGFGGFGGSNSGASLKYTDDEIDSYSDIFDNAETNVNEEDEQRVIAALKQLSEGTDLESCLDTDALIRYFAAHNFVINYDSYTGNMLHNYYLYEEDGKLTMLPWDYNLAFGGFGGGGGAKFGGNSEGDDKNADKDGFSDATSMINTGIDTPLSGSSEEDRPMWSWIASNEEYLEKYHEVYDELLKNYFENGTFEKEIERVYNMIKPYVEKDPSAFYTADEFEKAYETLKSFCTLRAESIRKQLDGSLSASTSEQKSEDKVDAGSLNVKDMGSQGGGRDGDMKNPMNFGGRTKPDETATTEN